MAGGINLLALEVDFALSTLEIATGNQTFTWQGGDYACVPHMTDDTVMFGAGGFTPSSTLELDVRAGVLPTPGPEPKQFLVYPTGGKRFRITDVITNPDLSLRIKCNDPARAAGIKEREM
jgi:hypothetical protein